MKHGSLFLLLALFTSCSDGDLQIGILDFNGVPPQFCEASATVSTSIFFKINSRDVLILELQDGVLKNEVSAGTIVSSVPGQSRITYRNFSEAVTKNYFCSEIPPANPKVTEEIEASAGDVLVTTTRSPSDSTAYDHTIELSGISLVNDKGERITDLTINEFGTITTK